MWWLEELEVFGWVREFWLLLVASYGIYCDIISSLVHFLQGLAKRLWPNFRTRIEQVHSAIFGVFERGDFDEQVGLMEEYHQILKEQEVYWQQRSRVLWLQAGDKNTNFFHRKASARRNSNTIRGLFNKHGIWYSSSLDIINILTEYFSSLFSEEPVSLNFGIISRWRGSILLIMRIFARFLRKGRYTKLSRRCQRGNRLVRTKCVWDSFKNSGLLSRRRLFN